MRSRTSSLVSLTGFLRSSAGVLAPSFLLLVRGLQSFHVDVDDCPLSGPFHVFRVNKMSTSLEITTCLMVPRKTVLGNKKP